MKRHIPNLITCLNAVSGTLALFMAMYGQLVWAAAFVLFAMVFDFFDGLTARLLHVKSEMGKELDSLADAVSFGVVPAVLAHFLIRGALVSGTMASVWMEQGLLFAPAVMPAFSAYRLAKFNLDARQSVSFIGMPTPANALFWVCLVFGCECTPVLYDSLFGEAWVLAACALLLSVLLVSELPMFSLKVSGFGWQENKIRYAYFASLAFVGIAWGKAVLLFVVPLYVLFAVVEAVMRRFTTADR
ncbi:MAG: CDP-diacylglycerol--serine O-phosphatidyltransferase [Odoribacter sp.]|nr:CDP-diacylglycerol--serine O-phosphatidyltransferase [Odoribacter sp.]